MVRHYFNLLFLHAEGDNLFPFGPEVGDSMFPQLDDGNTGPLNSTIPFPVFGSDENIFYVSHGLIIILLLRMCLTSLLKNTPS